MAADDARFGFTETTLGLVPALISPYVIAQDRPLGRAELCLSGARFGAGRAREIGLVHEVVAADDLDAAVARHVERHARTAPSAVAATKQILAAVYGRPPADVVDLTVDAIARQRASAEGREGTAAFLEKRPPSWTTSFASRPGESPDSPRQS